MADDEIRMWVCHPLFGVVDWTMMPPIDDVLPEWWLDSDRRDILNSRVWFVLSDWAEARGASVVELELPWNDLPRTSGWEDFRNHGVGPLTRDLVRFLADLQPTAISLRSTEGRLLFEQTNTWDDQRIFATAREATNARTSLRGALSDEAIVERWA